MSDPDSRDPVAVPELPVESRGAADPVGWQPPYFQVRVWRALRARPLAGAVSGAVLGVVLAVVSAVISLSGPTVYTSTTVMLINDPLALATAGSEGQLLKLDTLRYKYSGLVGTDAIAIPVAKKLDLPVGQVFGSVTAQVPLSSLLMDVVATWPTPSEAALLSQAVANQVTAYVHMEDVTNGIPPKDRFTFTTVDPASNPTPSGPSPYHAATLAIALAVLGLLVGFAGTQLVRNRSLLT
ncbi:MAG: YveK family protein [Acidimicrobiales bacterium]